MKDIEYVKPELPLIEVEEIPLDPWERRLAKQVNQDGHVHIFDDRVKIVDKIDVWELRWFYGVNAQAVRSSLRNA